MGTEGSGFLVVVGALAWGAAIDLQSITPGEAKSGEIGDASPVLSTPTLAARGEPDAHASTFELHVPNPGVVTLQARSSLFDTYLVVRDEAGAIVVEDDDGGLLTHSRAVLTVESGRTYVVQVGALRGDQGPFEVQAAFGEIALPSDETAALATEWTRMAVERRAVLGPDDPLVGEALYYAARHLADIGSWEESAATYRDALVVMESAFGPDSSEVASCLRSLGRLFHSTGEYAEGIALMRRALEIRTALFGPNELRTALAENDLASLLRAAGKVADAETYYRRALETFQKELGPEHPHTAATTNNLGLLLQSRGQYAEAEVLLRQALDTMSAAVGADHPQYIRAVNNLGGIYESMGRLEEAEALFTRALELSESTSAPKELVRAPLLHSLGVHYATSGQPEAGVAALREALELRERTIGADHPDTALTRNALAGALSSSPESRQLHLEALAVFERELGDHPLTSLCLHDLGLALLDLGDPDAGKAYLERAIAMRERLFGLDDLGRLDYLDTLARLLGSTDEGWDIARQVVDGRLDQAARQTILTSASDRFAQSKEVERALHQLVSNASGTQGQDDTLFESVSAWKGMVLRTSLRSRESLVEQRTPEQARLEEEIRALASRSSQLARASESSTTALAPELWDLRGRQRDLEGELMRSLGLDSQIPRLRPAQLGAALPNGSAFVDFWIHQPADGVRGITRVTAFVVRSGATHVTRVDLGSADELEARTSAYLRQLSGSSRPARGVVPAEEGEADVVTGELRRRLWDPLAAHLKDIDTVFLCPDRDLARLPFGAIQLEDGSFLIESFRVAYVDDGVGLERTLGSGPRMIPAEPALLTAGGVDYGEGDGPWSPLVHTRPETEAVRSVFTERYGEAGTTLSFVGTEATEERIKETVRGATFVHLATHGYFERPDESANDPGSFAGLVFAGANKTRASEGDDGHLTAREIASLPLDGCELVVLSACETGLGAARGGEGLLSVRRAFREAGAQTVVSSLWVVEDEATRRLVDDFYAGLWQAGLSPADALHRARRALLDASREAGEGPRPSAWGAFVLSGDWR